MLVPMHSPGIAPHKPVEAPAQAVAARPAAPVKAAAAPVEAAPASYIVRAGDTLYSIARRFNTAVDTLLALNKLSSAAVIQPGLRLRLH